MKKLGFTIVAAVISCVCSAQMYNVSGKIENTKGKTKVVMYELTGGVKWDTAYIGYFRGHYSLIMETGYKYQVWFQTPQDSVKVMSVEQHAVTAKSVVVDCDFNLNGSTVITEAKPKKRVQMRLLEIRMTPANRPEDFEKQKVLILNKR